MLSLGWAAFASTPALAATQVIRTDYTNTFINPCTGELLTISGPLELVITTTTNPQGGYHENWLAHPQGITGISQPSGTVYHAVGETRFSTNVNAGEQFSYVNNFDMISAGAGGNYLVHETLHFTVNANGTLTASVDHFSIDCR
jgi:hypothetical protein